MKIIFGLVLFNLLAIQLFAQFEPTHTGEVIKHDYYTISYVESYEQPEWVYYTILKGNEKRTDDFRPDPAVKTGSATLEDYRGSGYDRGHLCPAAAMKINHTAMSQTFFMSNMSPQEPYFNRGIWKNLEALIREWGWQKKTYVVTGPVFRDNKGTIGRNKVTIPGYYYKVIYQPEGNNMIGFILPNEKSDKTVSQFIVSVDSIEAVTGIDFFPQLDDNLENRLESRTGSISTFSNVVAPVNYPNTSNKNTGKTQCRGIAKSSGKRCKIMTDNDNGYCRYHQSQAH